jgi:hypothetical protein
MDNFGRKARGASVGALASDEHAKRREKCALRQARIAPMTAAVAASRRRVCTPIRIRGRYAIVRDYH